MTITSFEYFLILERERSFTRAAECLHISQQSLSAHIASLEKELGCKLFTRTVPLRLTYGGERFLEYAAAFEQNLISLDREMNDIAENRKGVLKVGIAHTRGRAILPSIIEKFISEYPGVRVELVEGSNEDLTDNLIKGNIDLAIGNIENNSEGVETKKYYKEEVVMLASWELLNRQFGKAIEANMNEIRRGDISSLKDCPFLMGTSADIMGRIGLGCFKDAGINPPVNVVSGNVETLLALCQKGVGVCFCPDNLAKAVLSPSEYNRLCVIHLGDRAKYDINFGYLKSNYQWSVVEDFMKLAKSYV